MAAKMLQHAIATEKSPLDQLVVESAGVAATSGEPAAVNSVAALKKVKIDLSQHRSQPVTQKLIDRAFAILGMTDSHLNTLELYNYSNLPKHICLFREFIEGSPQSQIPDPFGQDFDAYQECFDSILEAIPSLIKFLRRTYK